MTITPTDSSVASVTDSEIGNEGDNVSVQSTGEPESSSKTSSRASQRSVLEDFFEQRAYSLDGAPWQ
jgi:hypothetical protein